MLTPVVSFATNNDTNTGEGTVIEETTENVDQEPIVGYYELPEEERAQLALQNASFDTKEALLQKFTTYKYVAESTAYELYYDARTLGIIVRDKKSGAIMESVMSEETAKQRKYSDTISAHMTSAIAIQTLIQMDQAIGGRNTKVKTSDYMGCKDQKITVEELSNGFKANIDYVNVPEGAAQVAFDVIVTIDDKGVHINVPYESIVTKEANTYIGSMYLYSLMGYTERGDREGYMILPDGNGAIVNYENFVEIDNEAKKLVGSKFGSGYRQNVYGQDLSYKSSGGAVSSDAIGGSNEPEYVYAPYWGMVHSDTKMAVLGMVNKGETSMEIDARFNGVSGLLENFVGGIFVYRKTYYEPTDVTSEVGVEMVPTTTYIEDIDLTFMFKSGDEANYSGLALGYRDKLKEEGLLGDKASDKLQVRVDFLGTDKEDFLLFKRTITATTVDNIRDVINILTDNGVENLMVVYNGWQKGGIYSVPVSEYKVESSIGGKNALNKLAKELNEKGITFALGQETQYINTSNVKTTFDAAKKINTFLYNENRRFEEVYKNFRILQPSKTKSNVKKLVNDFVDNGIKNIAIDGLSHNLFSYSKRDVMYSREVTLKYYREALEQIAGEIGVSLTQPFKPYWSYMSAFLDLPLGHSMYNYESNEIPFLTMVLSGSVDIYSEYVNFEADKSEYFLKLAAYGVNPSFMLTYENPSVLQYTNSNWIYSSEYKHYMETIATYNEKLSAVKALTEGSALVSHSIENQVGMTEFANGVQVICDYENYYLAVYKDGKLAYGYNPQEELELDAEQTALMNNYKAVADAKAKVNELVADGIAKEYITAVKYKETKYSNGVIVYANSAEGKIYVEKDGKMVYGYNTSDGSELSAEELGSFTSQTSNEKVGEANE